MSDFTRWCWRMVGSGVWRRGRRSSRGHCSHFGRSLVAVWKHARSIYTSPYKPTTASASTPSSPPTPTSATSAPTPKPSSSTSYHSTTISYSYYSSTLQVAPLIRRSHATPKAFTPCTSSACTRIPAWTFSWTGPPIIETLATSVDCKHG
jgi:hypothetical protein